MHATMSRPTSRLKRRVTCLRACRHTPFDTSRHLPAHQPPRPRPPARPAASSACGGARAPGLALLWVNPVHVTRPRSTRPQQAARYCLAPCSMGKRWLGGMPVRIPTGVVRWYGAGRREACWWGRWRVSQVTVGRPVVWDQDGDGAARRRHIFTPSPSTSPAFHATGARGSVRVRACGAVCDSSVTSRQVPYRHRHLSRHLLSRRAQHSDMHIEVTVVCRRRGGTTRTRYARAQERRCAGSALNRAVRAARRKERHMRGVIAGGNEQGVRSGKRARPKGRTKGNARVNGVVYVTRCRRVRVR